MKGALLLVRRTFEMQMTAMCTKPNTVMQHFVPFFSGAFI
jgi:hypothetical protein